MSVSTIPITLQQAIRERLLGDPTLQGLLPGGWWLEPLSRRGTPSAFRPTTGPEGGQLLPAGVIAIESPSFSRPGLGMRRVTLTTMAWRGGGVGSDVSCPYPPTPDAPPQADPLVVACRRAIALLDSDQGAAGLAYGEPGAERETRLRQGVIDNDLPDDGELPARVVRCALSAPVLLLAGPTGG